MNEVSVKTPYPTLQDAVITGVETGQLPTRFEIYGCNVVLDRTTGQVHRVCDAQSLGALFNAIASELQPPTPAEIPATTLAPVEVGQ